MNKSIILYSLIVFLFGNNLYAMEGRWKRLEEWEEFAPLVKRIIVIRAGGVPEGTYGKVWMMFKELNLGKEMSLGPDECYAIVEKVDEARYHFKRIERDLSLFDLNRLGLGFLFRLIDSDTIKHLKMKINKYKVDDTQKLRQKGELIRLLDEEEEKLKSLLE